MKEAERAYYLGVGAIEAYFFHPPEGRLGEPLEGVLQTLRVSAIKDPIKEILSWSSGEGGW